MQAWEQYAWCWQSLQAVTDPKLLAISRYASLSDEDLSELIEERSVKLYDKEKQFISACTPKKKPKAKAKAEAVAKPATQVGLGEEKWPEDCLAIARRFPSRPYVTNNLALGLTVRPLVQAFAFSYIQYNSPVSDHLLIIDYDAPASVPIHEQWQLSGLGQPLYIASNADGMKGHIAWALKTPVATCDAAKLKPLQYLARIEEGYRLAMDGDKAFSGLITKNPIHERWSTTWHSAQLHTLDELAECVSISRYTSGKTKAQKAAEAVTPTGLGRKVLSFEIGRQWAYSAVSDYWDLGQEAWSEAVRCQIESINDGFESPLQSSHIKSVAKSIAGWVWKRFTPLTKHQLVLATHTPEVQAIRGRMSGKARRVGSAEEASPWLAEGISRETWYRRKGVRLEPISDNSSMAMPLKLGQ